VDQDRDLPAGGELEDRGEPLVVQQELLRPGMELDPPRAAVEHPCRFADRILCEIQADEGNHPSVRALAEGQRPVVPSLEAGMPVGLVEAEHEAAGDPVFVHPALEILVDTDHAVDVRAEMGVRVEDVGALREFLAQLVVPLSHQFLSTLQRVVHLSESMQGPIGSAGS
jgi:hypothetical protein